MNERIAQFLKAENLSPAQFADHLGIQRSGVSHLLAGRNKPGFDFIEKMLRFYPALNADWLITGKGKMYKEPTMPTLFGFESQSLESSTPVASPASSSTILSPDPANSATPVSAPASELHSQKDENNVTNSFNTNNSVLPNVARKLIKIVLFYSDNTYEVAQPQ